MVHYLLGYNANIEGMVGTTWGISVAKPVKGIGLAEQAAEYNINSDARRSNLRENFSHIFSHEGKFSHITRKDVFNKMLCLLNSVLLYLALFQRPF